MLLGEYIECGGSPELLVHKAEKHFEEVFEDGEDRVIECESREELDHFLDLIDQYSVYDIGFSRQEYTAERYSYWRRVYLTLSTNDTYEIHIGGSVGGPLVYLEDLIAECLEEEEGTDIDDDIIDLPDISELW